MTEIKLTEIEREHLIWKKIKDHVTECIEKLRKENDHSMDMESTSKLRGRITAYKEILRIGEEDGY